MLELYHDWRSFCSIKVRLCLAEKGLSWESRVIDLMKLEHTTAEYLTLNPNGVVPTLVHDGTPIHESTIINEYLDDVFPDVPLMPADRVERARARFWVKFEDDVLHPAVRPATFALMMSPELARLSDRELDDMIAAHPNKHRAEEFRRAARAPIDPQKVEAAKQMMQKALDRMERRLKEAPWLGGPSYSLADIAAAPFIDRLEELNLTGLWSGKPALAEWIARMKARPAYRLAIPATNQRFAEAYRHAALSTPGAPAAGEAPARRRVRQVPD
jgi:glutathione S-transferase